MDGYRSYSRSTLMTAYTLISSWSEEAYNSRQYFWNYVTFSSWFGCWPSYVCSAVLALVKTFEIRDSAFWSAHPVAVLGSSNGALLSWFTIKLYWTGHIVSSPELFTPDHLRKSMPTQQKWVKEIPLWIQTVFSRQLRLNKNGMVDGLEATSPAMNLRGTRGIGFSKTISVFFLELTKSN